MKKNVLLLIATLSLILVSCKKDKPVLKEELSVQKNETILLSEKSDNDFFTHTDHNISLIGDSMRLCVKLPDDIAFFNFSANPTDLNSTGEKFFDVLVSKTEMDNLAKNLSDTIIFKWADMTAVSPYPRSNCELLIYNRYNSYMCSIGYGDNAVKIMEELSKSLTGDAYHTSVEMIKLLKPATDITTGIKTIQ